MEDINGDTAPAAPAAPAGETDPVPAGPGTETETETATTTGSDAGPTATGLPGVPAHAVTVWALVLRCGHVITLPDPISTHHYCPDHGPVPVETAYPVA